MLARDSVVLLKHLRAREPPFDHQAVTRTEQAQYLLRNQRDVQAHRGAALALVLVALGCRDSAPVPAPGVSPAGDQTENDPPATTSAPRATPPESTETSADAAGWFVNVAPDTGLNAVIYCGGPDKSHILESVGSGCAWIDFDEDGLLDIFHATAQAVIAGANMILVDFHPEPTKALVDGPQALHLDELPQFIADVGIAREAYEKRRALGKRV